MTVQKLITLNSDGITEKPGGYLGIPSHYPLLFKPLPHCKRLTQVATKTTYREGLNEFMHTITF